MGCATLPEAITLLPSLGDDRPGQLDFQRPSLSHHRWARTTGCQKPSLSCLIGQARSETSVSRVLDSAVFSHTFLGPVLCLGVTSHRFHHGGDTQETAKTKNPTAERPENRGRPAEGSTGERKSRSVLVRPEVTPSRMRTFPIRGPLLKLVR